MAIVVGAAIVVAIIVFWRGLLLAFNVLFWGSLAALGGAIVGILVAHEAGVGAACGVALFLWWAVSSIVSQHKARLAYATSERAAMLAADAQEEARMRYQAVLNAEAMSAAAKRLRASA